MMTRVEPKKLAKVCPPESSSISHADLVSENEYHIFLNLQAIFELKQNPSFI